MAVYFIRATAAGLVKIGRAEQPERRLQTLQVSNFDQLELLRTIEGGPRTEAWLHRHFASLRYRGEWFRFSPEMLTIQPTESGDTRVRRPASSVVNSIIQKFGNQDALAACLGCDRSTISHWKRRSGHIPTRWQRLILAAARQKNIALTPDDFFEAA